MLAEVLTGIALVQKSVEFIKSNIDTAKDISSFAGAIDDLFRGSDEAEKARNKKAGLSISDQFGVESVAKEVIEAKLAKERLQEVATMIDLRFGPGTWRGIVEERAKRIQEAKEAAALARKKQREEQKEMYETLAIVGTVLAAILFIITLFIFIL